MNIFEIPADNVERATNFYMKVFKWELNPVPGVKYTRLLTIRVDDKVVLPRPFEVNGAIIKRTKEVTTPVVTVTVTDMDDTLKRIAKRAARYLLAKLNLAIEATQHTSVILKGMLWVFGKSEPNLD